MASLGPPGIVNIEDFRRAAKRRLPRAVFDYIDGGAEDERTLRRNSLAFERLTFRPRCAVATPTVDLATSVIGLPISMPLLLGPVGSCRMFYPKGEMAAARAAGDAGTIYALSTLSGCRLEDVKASSSGPVWYQLYLCGGRDVGLAAIERARKVGMSALVLTIDTAVAGMRERDLRNGAKEMLSRKVFAMLPYVWQYASRPGWVIGFLRDGGLMKFPNVILPDEGPMAYADVGTALEKSVVTWSDLRWIMDAWQGPIVIKGIHSGDDARRAVDEGASAVIVSNHGGRQLDSVRGSLEVLPEVVEAVSSRTEVLMDGGIRRGSDIVKALCLGARAVLIGRAYAYALGAAGGEGVAHAIDILRTELVRTMKLLGCPSVHELNRSYLDAPQVVPTPVETYV
jgi:L-lactate dehydrogenase (cytochrome)